MPNPPSYIVPMSSPDITEAERDAVAAVLRTPNLSIGPQIKAFEHAICDFSGAAHAIAVSSGTAGLHLCVRAADIGAGDLVITTPFSFVASANVLLFEGAVPVFVDVDPCTGNIDTGLARQAAEALQSGGDAARRWLPRRGTVPQGRLKGILPVDVFGQPADGDPLMALAGEMDLKVIEDSCEALGAEYKGRKAGTLGHYGCFAFYPNKQITTGEGAVIVTDDGEAATFMQSLRNQGRAPGDTWLQHTYLGYNYRLDEMSAALGAAQLKRIDTLLTRREQVAGWYQERLVGLQEVEILPKAPHTTRISWFVYIIRLAEGVNRDAFANRLRAQGIPNRPYFAPIHLQPYMVDRFGFREGDFPVTEDLGRRSLAIPFSGVMTEAQVETVCEAIKTAL